MCDDASACLSVCLDWQAVLVSPSKIKVSDVGSDVVEDLDFSGGRVVEMSLGFGHLVAATHNQVYRMYIYRSICKSDPSFVLGEAMKS